MSACETALWLPGTFGHAYGENRRAAIECLIDGDPVASRVRDIMARHKTWSGTAAELLRLGLEDTVNGNWGNATGWPKNPRALAGRLRRAQPALRSLGIDIVFSRQGREGVRIINISRRVEPTVRTVSPSAA